MSARVVAIIQGRMSSSRLPGKILADIAGQPMLQRVFIRTSRAAAVNETIFATTTDSSDDPVEEYCDFSGIPFTRGSLYDVLDRYYQTAKGAKANVVVRITADCPIIDPRLMTNLILFAIVCLRRGIEPIRLDWMSKLAPSEFWRKHGRKPRNLSIVNMPCHICMKECSCQWLVVGYQKEYHRVDLESLC